MRRRVKLNRERVTLRDDIDRDVYVMAHGYGEVMGQYLVGKVLGISDRRGIAVIGFQDEDGAFEESYSLSSGTRVGDEGRESGWRLNLADLTTDKAASHEPVIQSEISRLHHEVHPYASGEEAIHLEVWQRKGVSDKTDLYFMAYRQKEGRDDSTERQRRRRPVVVPFSLLKKVLSEFDTDW